MFGGEDEMSIGEEARQDMLIEEATSEGCWKTRDGRVLRIVDMDDQHLWHAIRMLVRNAPYMLRKETEAAFFFMLFFRGEMAQMVAEEDFYALSAMDEYEFLSLYTPFDALCEEMVQRVSVGQVMMFELSYDLLSRWIAKRAEKSSDDKTLVFRGDERA